MVGAWFRIESPARLPGVAALGERLTIRSGPFFPSFIVGFLVGAVEGALGVGRHPAIVILAGIGCGIPASVWAMRSALKQTYPGFRITFTSFIPGSSSRSDCICCLFEGA